MELPVLGPHYFQVDYIILQNSKLSGPVDHVKKRKGRMPSPRIGHKKCNILLNAKKITNLDISTQLLLCTC